MHTIISLVLLPLFLVGSVCAVAGSGRAEFQLQYSSTSDAASPPAPSVPPLRKYLSKVGPLWGAAEGGTIEVFFPSVPEIDVGALWNIPENYITYSSLNLTLHALRSLPINSSKLQRSAAVLRFVRLYARVAQEDTYDIHEVGRGVCVADSINWIEIGTGKMTRLSYTVATIAERLQVYVIQCSEIPLYVSYNYSFLNPGNLEGSLEVIPLSDVFIGFLSVYGLFFALWSFTLLRYHNSWNLGDEYPGVTKLQVLCAVVMFLKALEASMSVARSSELRTEKDPSSLDKLETATGAVSLIADIVMLIAMFLLSVGWTRCNRAVPARKKNVMAIGIPVYALCRLLSDSCSADEQWCSTFFVAYILEEVMLFGYAAASLNSLVDKLRQDMVESDNVEASKYFFVFRSMRTPFLFLAQWPLLVAALSFTVLSWRNQYVATTLREVTYVIFFSIVVLYLRNKTLVL